MGNTVFLKNNIVDAPLLEAVTDGEARLAAANNDGGIVGLHLEFLEERRLLL